MNIRLPRFPLMLLFALCLQQSFAQCEYRLDMFDSAGDGWNGSFLTITVGAATYNLTLNDFNDDGIDSTVYIPVTEGDAITVVWTPFFFVNGVPSFQFYDYDGNTLVDAVNPLGGTLYSGSAACPDCLKPVNVQLENIYDTRAKLRWAPGGGVAAGYWIIYGPQGFTPGPGLGDTIYLVQPKVTLTGLQEKVGYDFYLIQDCGNGVTSSLAGPYSFTTYFSDDVGISSVTTPLSGCDLGVETVTIQMSNYGANPQSLIPFNYSVNNMSSGVPQPEDGFYTGVIGKDSTETIEFETEYDFSESGVYEIKVWTEMNGDKDVSNDTFYYYIANRITAPHTMDFEVWNGGWYVDSNSVASSWEFGIPEGNLITPTEIGSHAWVTNLNGNYNPSEQSYLNSICFDFSDVTDDPVIEFSINYNTEFSYDGGFLEMSTDGGSTWERVGNIGTGLNWYTVNNFSFGEVWGGTSGGWVTARNELDGAAGESDVRLRFGFASDFTVQYEGMGIDDIHIYVPLKNDIYANSISTTGDNSDCGLENDKVTFTFSNFGTQSQAFLSVAYSINGGTPVVETPSIGVLTPNETYSYTFNTTFDSRDAVSNIVCWAQLGTEQNPSNDTTSYTVEHLPRPVPFQENFESTLLPDGWTSFGFVTNSHNNVSYVLAYNLYTFNPTFTHDLPRYGILGDSDTLTFDYRITDYSGNGTIATVLFPGNEIDVQVSTDCGQTYQTVYTIDALSHIPSVTMQSVKVPLNAYSGEAVKIRFAGIWFLAGDYWVDLDNINLESCASDMQITADIVTPIQGQSNGSATVSVGLGNPPYNYVWNTGINGPTISGLSAGAYTVTVTDALGCTDQFTAFVGITGANNIDQLLEFSLRPNPTTGFANLQLRFNEPVDVRVQVLNLLGQMVWETNASRSTELNTPIDLSNLPSGMYLVQTLVDGRMLTKKLVKE